jgi:hypothetical protein
MVVENRRILTQLDKCESKTKSGGDWEAGVCLLCHPPLPSSRARTRTRPQALPIRTQTRVPHCLPRHAHAGILVWCAPRNCDGPGPPAAGGSATCKQLYHDNAALRLDNDRMLLENTELRTALKQVRRLPHAALPPGGPTPPARLHLLPSLLLEWALRGGVCMGVLRGGVGTRGGGPCRWHLPMYGTGGGCHRSVIVGVRGDARVRVRVRVRPGVAGQRRSGRGSQ